MQGAEVVYSGGSGFNPTAEAGSEHVVGLKLDLQ